MKRFTGWRSSAAEDDGQQASPPEHSPTRSQLSNNSTSSRGASSSLRSGFTAPKSREQSPARFGAASADTLGAATGSSGGAVVAVSSKKMLKIGANVRFRGDVMECNTVVLCGRLQGFVETQRMTIKEGGMFIGDAKVEEADVYGSLDGSLESSAKVSIRSTGSVSGNVIYKKMTMEDGGELEGTFECSNRVGGRLRNREGSATGGVGGLRRGSRDDSGALAVRDNQNTISPPGKQSPILWQNGQGAAYAGGAAAAAAAAGEEAWAGGGRVGAALERAGGGGGTGTGAGGSGSGSVMSSVARLEASPRGNPVPPGGTAAATTPVGVGTGGGALRRITPTGAGLSTAVRAPSPLRPTRGLQVQGLGAEAGELFCEEAVTPVGESGAGVTNLPSTRSRRLSATAGGGGGGGGGDGSAEEEGTSGGGGTSVAARVGTWPPPSPVPTSTRLWQRRTENHTTPAPAPSPAPPSTTAAPPAQTSGSVTQNTVKSLVESYKPPYLQGSTTASQRQQQEQPGSVSAASRTLAPPSVADLAGSGPVGNGDGVAGGGAGVGRMGIPAEEKLDNYESALEEESDSDSAAKISGPVKACEVEGCTLEACWGDPRFRPRYCARHKKQGNKLMSPVEAEEGDKSAASPESSPPMEPLPSPAKPLTDLKLGARGLPSVQRVEPPNGSGGGGGHSTESDGLESDEDEDEGWDSGGGAAVVAAVGGRLVAAANGGSNLGGTSGGSGGGFSGGGGRGGGGGGGFGVQPALPVVQAELVGNDDDRGHHNPDTEGYDEPEPVGYGGYGAAGGGGGGGGAADAEAEDADDVQARVAAYTRLAGKKQPQTTAHVPSLPKPKAQKPKKRASATNIADFYGGGESDDDEEGTGYSMDAYNKGVLLNQAAEVGTHTEDGQLRPQASSERDQQKLAHLVRVGKLGAALRGKGVTSGKRR